MGKSYALGSTYIEVHTLHKLKCVLPIIDISPIRGGNFVEQQLDTMKPVIEAIYIPMPYFDIDLYSSRSQKHRSFEKPW